MKDTISHSKLVKNKRKHHSSDSSESSDSENETVPVIKYSKENDSDDSNSDDSSRKDARKMKRRKHHHHHHHHHRRKHKLKEGERIRHDVVRERYEEHISLRHAHSLHRRHGEQRVRVRTEENIQYSGSSSRHRQHRDDSAERIRHHRKRDGESRQRRDVPQRVKKHSTEQEERDQLNSRKERRGDTRNLRERGPRNGEQISVPADRPIKQERVSPEPEYQWGKDTSATENQKGPPVDKAKPNFGLSGKLAEETNTFNGVILKYSEPQEARKPKRRWRFYPFKGDAGLPTLYLHRQSCYLIGRDRKVADIPVDHPSCSKQHAALQYRLVPYQRDNGTTGRRVRPYIIDLESANGTYVNNNKIEAKKYIELLEKDVVKFGYSSREYVLLHEHSKDDELDDDIAGNVE